MTITTSMSLSSITCGVCSIPFALETSHLATLQSNGRWFYCPNGHHIHYNVGETAEQKVARLTLQLQREQEDARIARATAQGERLRAERERERRLKSAKKLQRAERGICTDCHRTFPNVQRHRMSKHPAPAGAR